ncbi:MAG: LysM peptidoglycan-binding domain-containing protein, partial [Desulfobulbaceae bacterium]|nr:LysM peptidoglycan-binding domain-containing protein [Desulfobulbaceae bacterium]
AGKIAMRHGVKLQDLIFANRLNRHATIYVGQNLRIPTRGEKISRLAKVKPISNEPPAPQAVIPEQIAAGIAALEKPIIAPTFSKQPGRVPDVPKPVASKPTASESSEQTPARIEQEEIIQTYVATEMTVMAKNEINPAVVSGHLQVEKMIKRQGETLGVIRVEAEETLGHYAEWLGVSAQEIRLLNKIRFGKKIRINQSLNVPFQKTGAEEFEEKRYEYHKEVEEDFFVAYRVHGVRTYEIRKGDNIWTLCRAEFDMPFWLVKKYNPALNFNGLIPDQKIQIPVVEEITES